jgi:hypothetical protein
VRHSGSPQPAAHWKLFRLRPQFLAFRTTPACVWNCELRTVSSMGAFASVDLRPEDISEIEDITACEAGALLSYLLTATEPLPDRVAAADRRNRSLRR